MVRCAHQRQEEPTAARRNPSERRKAPEDHTTAFLIHHGARGNRNGKKTDLARERPETGERATDVAAHAATPRDRRPAPWSVTKGNGRARTGRESNQQQEEPRLHGIPRRPELAKVGKSVFASLLPVEDQESGFLRAVNPCPSSVY